VLRSEDRTFFLSWAVTTGLATGASSAVAAFTVTGGLGHGLDPAMAGVVLSVGSVVCVLIRLTGGVLADRPRSVGFPTVIGLLVVGALGALLMLVAGIPGYVIGAWLVLGPGWAWPGLSHHLVSQAAGPATPAATGIVQTGTFVGACLGPILAGLIMSDPGREGMLWAAAAAAFAIAAGCGALATRGRSATRAGRDGASPRGSTGGTVAEDIAQGGTP
jgi:MFS family permease